MNKISFNTANFVARQVNYQMTGGWGQGDRTTQAYFKPLDTFKERFADYLADVRAANFSAIDLWTCIINPEWATEEHIQNAVDLCQQNNLEVVSFSGWFGSTLEEFEGCCKLAVAFGRPILGGSTSMLTKDRSAVVDLLQHYNLKLGIENHPEKLPEELREKVGDGGNGTIGVCVDTGWFGTQGYNAAQALRELKDVLFLVHLKDVLAVDAHDTCRYEAGIVGIRSCVQTLQEIGYSGAISVEHEPEMFNPMEDVIASHELLLEWLS